MVLKYHGPLHSYRYPNDSAGSSFTTWRKGDIQRNSDGTPANPVPAEVAAYLLTHSKHKFTSDQATVDAAADHIENMPSATNQEVSVPSQEPAQPPVPAEVLAAATALGSNTPAVETSGTQPTPTPPAAKLRAPREP